MEAISATLYRTGHLMTSWWSERGKWWGIVERSTHVIGDLNMNQGFATLQAALSRATRLITLEASRKSSLASGRTESGSSEPKGYNKQYG